MTQATRQSAMMPRPTDGSGSTRPVNDAAASVYAAGVAGLTVPELTAMIHTNPVTGPSAPDELAPYLATSPGLSAEAYKEWLARVCEQPADD